MLYHMGSYRPYNSYIMSQDSQNPNSFSRVDYILVEAVHALQLELGDELAYGTTRKHSVFPSRNHSFRASFKPFKLKFAASPLANGRLGVDRLDPRCEVFNIDTNATTFGRPRVLNRLPTIYSTVPSSDTTKEFGLPFRAYIRTISRCRCHLRNR